VTTARMGLARIGRLLCGATVVALVVLFLGCAAAGPPKKLIHFGKDSRDETLRKKVEADPFPSAQKAGL
jgi:hypothetical protein